MHNTFYLAKELTYLRMYVCMYVCMYACFNIFQKYTDSIKTMCTLHTYMCVCRAGDLVWPTELQGLKLGNIVQDIREDGKMVFGYKDRMQKLNDLDFSWEVSI